MRSPVDCWHPAGLAAAVLLCWAAAALLQLVDPVTLPAPWSVAGSMLSLATDAEFGAALVRTLCRVFTALLFAAMAGIPFGLLLGWHRGAGRLFGPYVHGLRSVPATSLFPLVLIVVGVGEMSVLTLAAYPSLLIIAVSTAAGASLANPHRLRFATTLGMGSWEILTEVVFFEALPHALDGVRIAASYALVLVVAIEMFIGGGAPGLGRAIFDYQATYRIPETFAAILIAALIGIAINGTLSIIEQRLLRWLPNAPRNRTTV